MLTPECYPRMSLVILKRENHSFLARPVMEEGSKYRRYGEFQKQAVNHKITQSNTAESMFILQSQHKRYGIA